MDRPFWGYVNTTSYDSRLRIIALMSICEEGVDEDWNNQ